MSFREVNENDILKVLFEARDEALDDTLNDEDKKHETLIDEISEKILKNVPKQNEQYVKKQFELLEDNFSNHTMYWQEKYYRNGFCDAFDLIKGLLKNN